MNNVTLGSASCAAACLVSTFAQTAEIKVGINAVNAVSLCKSWVGATP
jgi:hypothetical protein